ncbi:MAG: AraC family transcriptional regulator [Paludibacter sp.]|nr:AraC family transcriptional regulator [Paludibacter sp.]
MEFIYHEFKHEFKIDSLVSLHYFEFAKDFIFAGESHNFWEVMYVDKGEVEVTADKNGYVLKQGDMIFHKPNEFHSVWANKRIAPNIVVVSFVCKSEAMEFFCNKIFVAGNTERNILGGIIKEGYQAFLPPFDNPHRHELVRKNDSRFGSEQMIKVHIQTLLIELVRRNTKLKKVERLSTVARERAEEDFERRLEKFLVENISEDLTLNDVCKHMKMSRTLMIKLFKSKKDIGIMEYFRSLKIEQAKKIIREGNHNITEVSELLGYSSIHSFSRHFSKTTNMSPSEYAKSVQSRLN